MPNSLIHNHPIEKGLQWAIYVTTDVNAVCKGVPLTSGCEAKMAARLSFESNRIVGFGMKEFKG